MRRQLQARETQMHFGPPQNWKKHYVIYYNKTKIDHIKFNFSRKNLNDNHDLLGSLEGSAVTSLYVTSLLMLTFNGDDTVNLSTKVLTFTC